MHVHTQYTHTVHTHSTHSTHTVHTHNVKHTAVISEVRQRERELVLHAEPRLNSIFQGNMYFQNIYKSLLFAG